MAQVYNSFNLYTTSDRFLITPEADGALECLSIDRLSNEVAFTNRRDLVIPEEAGLPQSICGIVGIARFPAVGSGVYLIVITRKQLVAKIGDDLIYKMTDFEILPFSRTTMHLNELQIQDNKTCVGMITTVLQTDGFYFSYTFDVTHTLQRLQNTGPDFRRMPLYERADSRFVWNSFVSNDLALNDQLQRFLLPLMHGFIEEKSCKIGRDEFKLCLISRRSRFRAGVRFYRRGLDSEGNAANFVETEQILQYKDSRCAFVQIRGSIPIFWNQDPNLKWAPMPTILPNDHKAAFRTHIIEQYLYGKQTLVNLVNSDGRESRLGTQFRTVVQQSEIPDINLVEFDFHKECGSSRWYRLSLLVARLGSDIQSYGYFREGGGVNSEQSGVFRTNCIDCLDRTNVVQSMIALEVLNTQLTHLGILSPSDRVDRHQDFVFIFKNMWADNGNSLSVQYAGTPALKADFTRTGKRTLMGKLNDGQNALIRYVKNNFYDGFRQDSISLFLGNYVMDANINPLRNSVTSTFKLVLLGLLVSCISLAILSFVLFEGWSVTGVCMLLVIAILVVIYSLGDQFVDKPKLV